MGGLISSTIDFEQSKARSRAAVATGIDPQLDKLKRAYEGMESFLTRVDRQMSQELPAWARKYILNCVFYPQLGFLTVVSTDRETEKSDYSGEGLQGDIWEKMFAAEDKVYYKNNRMKDLDNHFGDIYCAIVGRFLP